MIDRGMYGCLCELIVIISNFWVFGIIVFSAMDHIIVLEVEALLSHDPGLK